MFLHFARSCSPSPSSNMQASRIQVAFSGYDNNMNIATKDNLLCISQQRYDIEFASPN
jgi:hypothetical protein